MMDEFVCRYEEKTRHDFDPVGRHIQYGLTFIRCAIANTSISIMFCSCLAHIVNVATQKLISTYSKSAFYESEIAGDVEPEYSGNGHDVVGLIRAIAVKVSPFLYVITCITTQHLFYSGEVFKQVQGTFP
jgi:hypothetical protein